jgi:hypothetical protein
VVQPLSVPDKKEKKPRQGRTLSRFSSWFYLRGCRIEEK